MTKQTPFYLTSIGRKQIVATTGLMLILFIVGHLAGNLLFFGGPEIYNAYASKLKGLRPALYVVEAGLALVFIVHIIFTYLLVIENVRSRPKGYRVMNHKGDRSFAAQIMPFTGTILFAFVLYHLWDFTFTPHDGARSILRDGINYGVYGLVYNAFSDWQHSGFYIIAMMSLGFHLSHGLESFFQTYGFLSPKGLMVARVASQSLGVGVGLLYSSIPIYVLIKNLSGY